MRRVAPAYSAPFSCCLGIVENGDLSHANRWILVFGEKQQPIRNVRRIGLLPACVADLRRHICHKNHAPSDLMLESDSRLSNLSTTKDALHFSNRRVLASAVTNHLPHGSWRARIFPEVSPAVGHRQSHAFSDEAPPQPDLLRARRLLPQPHDGPPMTWRLHVGVPRTGCIQPARMGLDPAAAPRHSCRVSQGRRSSPSRPTAATIWKACWASA